MKTIFLLLIAGFCFTKTNAQSNFVPLTACPTPFGCGNKLTDSIFHLSDIDTLTETYGKVPMDSKFHDVLYGKTLGDCTTSADSTMCTDDGIVLKYKAFYPRIDYTNCKLGVVFVIHGGGFKDCNGSYLDSGIVKICQEFAKKGLIAISVEYRLGALAPSLTNYSAQQELAIYRAAQDIRGYLRTAVKRQDSTEPTREPYRFDTSKMFIAGASAGSVVAMSAMFYTQPMLNQVYPGINNSAILGGVDKNFYYGESTITYNIKGFMDMWGGLSLPPTPAYLDSPELFFKQNIASIPPTIIFHGKKDPVFNYKNKNVVFYQIGMYHSESNCLQDSTATYTLPTGTLGGYLLGGLDIYNMLGRMKIGAEVYIDRDMYHGFTTDSMGFHGNFGVSANTDAETTAVYMVGRAAIFFQAIYNNKVALLTTTKFIECENDRIRCFVADNNNSCHNTDVP